MSLRNFQTVMNCVAIVLGLLSIGISLYTMHDMQRHSATVYQFAMPYQNRITADMAACPPIIGGHTQGELPQNIPFCAGDPWDQPEKTSLSDYFPSDVALLVPSGGNVWTLVSDYVSRLHPGQTHELHEATVAELVSRLQEKITMYGDSLGQVTDVNVVPAGWLFNVGVSDDYIGVFTQ